MGCEIIKINENTWRMEDGMVRFFLLAGTERALLIDSGMMTHDAKDIAESLTTLPVSLLNTHTDGDHTGSNAQFAEIYMHPQEESLYRSKGGQGEVIPKLIEGSSAILAGTAEYREEEMRGNKIRVYDMGYTTFLCGTE